MPNTVQFQLQMLLLSYTLAVESTRSLRTTTSSIRCPLCLPSKVWTLLSHGRVLWLDTVGYVNETCVTITRAFQGLLNPETGLYLQSPSYLYELYKRVS